MFAVALLTVPRTGTGFFRELLRQHLPDAAWGDFEAGRGGFLSEHVSQATIERLAEMSRLPEIVTTWRPRLKVEASHAARGDDLGVLARQWSAWLGMRWQFPHHLVTVEPSYCGKPREELLQELGRALGFQFSTNWEPVNALAGGKQT